jgi:hypothetical protein
VQCLWIESVAQFISDDSAAGWLSSVKRPAGLPRSHRYIAGRYCYAAAVNESSRISDSRVATAHAMPPAIAFVALFALTDLHQIIARASGQSRRYIPAPKTTGLAEASPVFSLDHQA